MARERWFYAPIHKRQGPVPLAQLVEALLRLPDPRSCLVWRNGLPSWTPAGDVADVDRHLAPFVAARKPQVAHDGGEGAEGPSRVGTGERARARVRTAERASKAVGPSPLVYAGAGAGTLLLAGLVYFFWPKSPPQAKGTAGGSSPGVIMLKEGDPATGRTAPTGGGAVPGQAGFAGWSDQEANVPNSELLKLRGVAGYAQDTLEVTVYNGSTWRITELFVRRSRLVNDNWVEDDKPLNLLPVGEQVEEGVDKLLDKVAPDRRKPGVNPLDTGKFVGKAGTRPQAFKAPIIAARGYPPR